MAARAPCFCRRLPTRCIIHGPRPKTNRAVCSPTSALTIFALRRACSPCRWGSSFGLLRLFRPPIIDFVVAEPRGAASAYPRCCVGDGRLHVSVREAVPFEYGYVMYFANSLAVVERLFTRRLSASLASSSAMRMIKVANFREVYSRVPRKGDAVV